MKYSSLLVGTMLVSGCTSLEAWNRGPIEPIPVAPDAPARWAAAGVAGEAETGDWLGSFNDQVMNDLVAEALDNNYSLDAQLATVRAAAADALAERGTLLPFLSGSMQAGGRRSVSDGPGGNRIETNSGIYGLGINASWEADLWGRLAAGVDISETSLVIAEADLAAARLSVASQTAIGWINLNAAIAQQRVAEATVAARQRVVETTERRFSRGLVSALDVRTARSALAQADANLAGAERQTLETARRLEVLLGRYPAAEISAPARLPGLDPIEPVSSPTLLLARRPDIAAAEARLVQSGLRAEQARLALLPSLNVTASLSTNSDDISQAFDPAYIAGQALANLTQPLYAGGQLSARAEAFLNRVDAALATYAQTVLGAWQEVENTIAADYFLARQEEAQSRALEEAAFAEELAERNYREGTITIFNLIDAQTRRLNSESGLVTARSNRAINRVQYYLALGGGVYGALPDGADNANAGQTGGSPTP